VARGLALNAAGVIAHNLSDFPLARTLLFQALDIRRQLQDRQGVAASLHNLGNTALYQGELDDAQEYYTQALEIRREQENRWSEAYCLNGLGTVNACRQEFAAAREYFQQALAVFEEIHAISGKVLALGNTGNVLIFEAKPAEAVTYLEAAIALCRETEYREGEAMYLISLSNAFQMMDETGRALDCLRQALWLIQKIGGKIHAAAALEMLASIMDTRGDRANSVRMYGCTGTWRTRNGAKRPEYEQRDYEQRIAALRAALGETEFTEQWQAGERLPMETALTEALEQLGETFEKR
jgi:tetratricopeptide (TPR) repeat protein